MVPILDFLCQFFVFWGVLLCSSHYILLWIAVLPHVFSRVLFSTLFQLHNQAKTERNMSSPKQNKIWIFFCIFDILYANLDFLGHLLIIFGYFCLFLDMYYELMSYLMYFHDFLSTLFQLHNQAETEKHVKSKTKQNLELSAKNKELTQSLKQLHQSFLATNQVRCRQKLLLFIGY